MNIRSVFYKLEHVKLRTVFFVFVASFTGLIISWTTFVTNNYHDSHDFLALTRLRRLLSGPSPRNVVIIVSNRRSGTTFLGKIFSQKQESFYLFEPLLPYTTECNTLKDERVTTLTKFLDCNFSSVYEDYEKALKITGYSDKYSKCMQHTTCFADKNGALLDDYSQLCGNKQNTLGDEYFDPESEECGYPLKPHLLSELCNSASIVAYKIVRVCSLEMLEPLYRHLTMRGHRVFVIHLLRDPRAVLASRLQLGLDGLNKTTFLKETRSLCERYRTNINYANRMNISEKKEIGSYEENVVTDGRYMRIRYEDFVSDAVGVAYKIYDFMDSDLPPEVESWIRSSQVHSGTLIQQAAQRKDKSLREKATQRLGELVHPFGTTRDPNKVLRKWRWFFTFQYIEIVQQECRDVMKELNYDQFHSYKDLLNFSMPSYH
ncbi:carbohydrate sulfotransferase 1-like [Styela clava]